MNIDFFATLAKRVSVKNYSKESVEAGIEVLEFSRQLFPSPEDQERYEYEIGHLLLQICDFQTQLRILHRERMHRIWGAYAEEYKKPLWNGIPEKGKTILMIGEGGFGDEIFCSKYSHSYNQVGMKVVFATNYESLKSIFSRIKTIDEIISIQDVKDFEDYNYWIPAGETPLAFDFKLEDMPTQPYLMGSEEYLKKWKEIIPNNGKLKVGVRWSGNKTYEGPANTIIPFEYFDDLTSISNIEFYSLQRDDGVEEITKESKIIPLHDHLETWEDTLAAISQLDLVISSSTCIPVISAALGVPTWSVIPLFPYCLWLGEETKSFWFGDTIKLYRQSKVNSWKEPFEKVKNDLNEQSI